MRVSGFLIVFTLLVCLTILTPDGLAQSTITGGVKDESGAVLPGVTIEATSPALIEKVRSAVSDGTGQYRIENLRPGMYTVKFVLTGFKKVIREGIIIQGTFSAPVNAEMQVGALEETITVSGESPTVDVSNNTTQFVVDRDLLRRPPDLHLAPTERLAHRLGLRDLHLLRGFDPGQLHLELTSDRLVTDVALWLRRWQSRWRLQQK